MKLSFYARPGCVVYPPGEKRPGAVNHYVGRRFDPESRAHNALEKPAEFDSETDAGRELMRRVRRDHSLWAADAETAAACGVPFVDVALSGGEWQPKSDKRARPASPAVQSGKADPS